MKTQRQKELEMKLDRAEEIMKAATLNVAQSQQVLGSSWKLLEEYKRVSRSRDSWKNKYYDLKNSLKQ